MKAELFADKTLSWFENFMNSPYFERVCWSVIAAAALYFAPIVLATFLK